MDIDKDWCLNMAKLEGDAEIGAGRTLWTIWRREEHLMREGLQSVFLVTFGKNTLRDPRIVGVFSTMQKAKAACEQDFEAVKGGQHAYVSSTDYDVTEYFVDANR